MIEMDMPKIEVEESEDQSYAKVIVEPLEKGFGLTIGNCLRRILLSALPGAAAQGIRFLDGSVKHEFSAVPGVKEDVTEIIMNIKSLQRGSLRSKGGGYRRGRRDRNYQQRPAYLHDRRGRQDRYGNYHRARQGL